MTTFLILLLIIVNVYGQTNLSNIDKDNYIVGGKDAKIRDFPFMVLIIVERPSKRRARCGGTYIHSKWVLTTARCVTLDKGFPPKIIRTGAVRMIMGKEREDQKYLQTSSCVQIIVHPFYGVQRYLYLGNIALIRLGSRITTGPTVRIANLLKSVVAVGANVTAIGWGATKITDYTNRKITRPKKLQRVDLTTKSCYGSDDKQDSICVGRKGKVPCFEDFGGPLVLKGSVVGVASHVLEGCKGDTAVYVALDQHFFWINGMIGQGRKAQTSNACNLNVTLVIYFIICVYTMSMFKFS